MLDPHPRPLRRQLLLWLLSLLIPLLLAGVVAAYLAGTFIANLAYDRALLRAALSLADQVEVVRGTVKIDLPQAALDLLEYDKDDWVYYRVTGPDGEIVTGDRDLALPPRLPEPGKHLYFDAMLDGKQVRVAAFVLALKGTSAHGVAVVQVAETLSKRELMAEEIMAAMVLPQLLMVFLAGIMVWYGVKRGLLPLDKLRNAISQRSHLDLSPVPAENAPQEVQPLLHSMNDLMGRVREAMSLQQRFVADASHQLRTPLAGLQTQAEMALRERDPATIRHALQRILASTERLSHLVGQLLALARVEPGPGREASSMQPLDLVQLARETTAQWVAAALARDIDLGFECAEPQAMVLGDAVLLREMLANLLDNAIRYLAEHGEITVRITRDQSHVLLMVEDNGPGIPHAERARVFERFYRLPDSTGDGCGLGLAIVREIVLAHQATITISDAASGHGTRVMVAFPAETDPS